MSADWSPFGGNPVPGDPGRVRALAQQFRDFSDQVRQQGSLLQQIHSGVGGVWTGPAASSFAPHIGKLPGQLTELHTSYATAADALDGYWPQLADAQNMATTALARAYAAQQAQQAAQAARQQDQQQFAAQQAQQASLAAQQGLPFAPPPYTPSPGVTAQASQADAAWQAAVQLKDEAASKAQSAARQAAAQLDSVARPQIENPLGGPFGTLVSDLQHGGQSAEDFFSKHMGDAAGALIFLLGIPPPGDIRRDLGDLGKAGEAINAFFQRNRGVIEPILKEISLVAEVVSTVLIVVEIALLVIPGGGEVADAILSLAQVFIGIIQLGADTTLAVEYHDKEAQDRLGWDALTVATFGIGRLVRFGEIGMRSLRAAHGAEEADLVAGKLAKWAQEATDPAERGHLMRDSSAVAEVAKKAWELAGGHGVYTAGGALEHGALRSGSFIRVIDAIKEEHAASAAAQNTPKIVREVREAKKSLELQAQAEGLIMQESVAKLGRAPVMMGRFAVAVKSLEYAGKSADFAHRVTEPEVRDAVGWLASQASQPVITSPIIPPPPHA